MKPSDIGDRAVSPDLQEVLKRMGANAQLRSSADMSSPVEALNGPLALGSLQHFIAPPLAPAISPISTSADLGRLVRQRRKALGFSQQQLADSAGVGRRFVSELENGKDTLEFGRLIAVCGAVGLDLFAKGR